MSEADAGDLEQPQPLRCRAYHWKPNSSAQKQRRAGTRAMSRKTASIEAGLARYVSHDALAHALCFMNTGRSHSYKVLTYGRANTLDASIKKALLKLVQGLCSRYREQRDIAAMQLNQAVNPAGHA